MNRILLAGGAVALALVASSCSSVGSDAATINDEAIKVRDFESQLQAFVDNDAYQEASTSAGQPSVLGPGGDGTVSMEFTGRLLGLNIQFELLRQEAEERGIVPTAVQRQTAEEQARQLFVSGEQAEAVWNGFPESFQRELSENLAYAVAVRDSFGAATALDDAALQAIYDELPERFGLMCARHVLVETEAEAAAVLAELEGGADFETVAKERSTDPSAQENGGLLYEGDDCPVATTFDPDFVTGALSVPVGELAGPIQTQFGYHVILVDKVTPLPFADAKDSVQQYATQQAQTEFGKVLRDAAKGDITVNPRFGTWDAAELQVVPPGTATTTTVAG